MVQFCPKCGTQAPDDESVFCNKCGARLPPGIPIKKEIVCPRCGTTIPDKLSVFCDRCGSPLEQATPARFRHAGAHPPAPAIPPRRIPKQCLSCRAPVTEDDSDYCNACLAQMSGPEPPAPLPWKKPQPDPVRAPPAIPEPEPVPQESSGTGTPLPVTMGIPEHTEPAAPKRDRKSVLVAGVIAVVAIIVIVALAGFVTGMIPGSQSQETTPALPAEEQTTPTTIPTTITTAPSTPKLTPSPVKTTAIAVPTTTAANASATLLVNASTGGVPDATTNSTANVTPTATRPLSNIDASRPFSLGETATDGKGKLTVNGYTVKDKLSDPTPSYAIGKKYLILDITYENLQQDNTTEVDLRQMNVRDGGGFSFDQVTDDPLLENPFYLNGKSVPPRETRTGNMAFIVPQDATFLKFEYNFGDRNIAVFQLPQYL